MFDAAEMIVKVKEPQAIEIARLKPHHILFTYLHLAADPEQAQGLMASGCTAIAYETVTDRFGPPAAAGADEPGRRPDGGGRRRLSPAEAARRTRRAAGRRAGRAGRRRCSSWAAASPASTPPRWPSATAPTSPCSTSPPPRLEQLDDQFGGRLKTAFSTHDAVAELLPTADLVIGCVLIPGAAAPKLVTRADVARMRPGAVLVDVAIDQGGCFETSHPTTHADPTFVVDGVVHYCVANMPGAAPLTSTYALTRRPRPTCFAWRRTGRRPAARPTRGWRRG